MVGSFGAIGLLLAPAVVAFGTINSLGQEAEHERITRIALQCPDGEYKENGDCFEPISMISFAGGNGTFGAIGAPDGGADALKSEAHCDDADYMDYAKWGINGTYPHSKDDRNKALAECYTHMRELWEGGIKSASELLDSDGKIIAKEVVLAEEGGKGLPCVYSGSISGRAKCDAFEGLGRALHGLQDFYSHSNWVDDTGVKPAEPVPPGLGQKDIAPFLSMVSGSGPSADNLPEDLSTGCFNLFGHDTVEGAAACEKEGRFITHVVMNKDKGKIETQPLAQVSLAGESATLTSVSRTERGNFSDNFERAVRGAVLETRRQWGDFRTKLVQTYGVERGKLMICALTRDFPLRDCGREGNTVALVLGGPSVVNVAEELRNRVQPSTRVGIFDRSKQYAAFGSNTSLSGIKGEGDLDKGIGLAVDTLNGTDRDSIIVIASELGSANVAAIVTSVQNSEKKKIRLSIGLLPSPSSKRRRALRFWRRDTNQDDNNAVASAVLRTGGTFAVLANEDAKDEFASHVLGWGGSQTKLFTDLTVYDDGDRDFSHEFTGENVLNVTVTAYNGSATLALSEDGKERGRASGSVVSLQHKDKDTTVTASVQHEGLYSIALTYASAALPTSFTALPVMLAGLAYVFV